MTSIGPGPESVDVQLYAPAPTSGRWDAATWDGGSWAAAGWQSVDCDVIEASFVRGVTDEAGVLSQSGAGPMDLSTLDPNRELDPANASSPFFGYVAPGAPVRLMGGTAGAYVPVWSGWIDEATHDVASQRGRVRCIDAIAQLAQANVPDGTVLPNTLRARVRAVVAAAGLSAMIPVQPEPPATIEHIVNGSFANGMASWPPYVGPAGTPGTDLSVGSFGRFTGNGTSQEVQSVQWVPVVEGTTYTLSATLAGTGAAGHPAVLTADARTAAGAAVAFDVMRATVVPAVWTPVIAGSYTVPIGQGITQLSVRVGMTQTDGSAATSAHVAFAYAVSLTEPGPSIGPDPAVAPFDGKSAAAWTVIQNAALDALTLVWLDPSGALRFTSWGSLPDAVVSLGCPPIGDTGSWIGGLSTIVYGMSAAAIRNRVRAYSSGTVWSAYVDDAPSLSRYGARPLDVDRIVPSFATWAANVLADRADAGLSVTLGEVRPYDAGELQSLLDIGTNGPQVIRVADSDHGAPIDDDVGIVGTAGRITSAGWSFRYVTMIPRADFDQVEPPPIEPPIPPPATYHTETRVYVATSDALLALTSGGSKYGAGASNSLPVGVWSGWTYRACIQLPAIPWTQVRRIVSATLKLRTSTQVRVGFGSSPTIELQRITGSWSAGSSSSPSGGNAVVYPGPSTTTAGAVRKNMPTSQNSDQDIRIDAIALAWAPSSIGGSAAAQRGVMLLPGSGSGADTTEVWPVEQGGSSRPQLTLVVEVFD